MKFFNLQEYTISFGIYHGEVLKVELLFDKELSQEASQYNFHPNQVGKFNDDGSYTLKFKASGSKEIMWHVFKWGEGCKIVKPASLNKQYKEYLSKVLSNQ